MLDLQSLPLIQVSSVLGAFVPFQAAFEVFLVDLVFVVLVKRSCQRACGRATAPPDSLELWRSVRVGLASGSSSALPALAASVVAEPVESFVDVAVVLMRSGILVGLPSVLLRLRVLVPFLFREC